MNEYEGLKAAEVEESKDAPDRGEIRYLLAMAMVNEAWFQREQVEAPRMEGWREIKTVVTRSDRWRRLEIYPVVILL